MNVMLSRKRAVASLLGGLGLSASAASLRAQESAKLRIATIPIEPGAQGYYAQDTGFFAKAGIGVDITAMTTGPGIAAALVSNAVDIGFGSVDAVAAIHQKNVPLVLIAAASDYVPASARTTALVVPAASTLQTAKDLKGKTIAVTAINGITHTVAEAWLDQNGGDSSLAKFVEIPLAAMPAALAAGRVDAVWISQPFLEQAKKDGRVLVYGFDTVAKSFISTAWLTTAQWANDHPSLVRRFAAVMRQTATWANTNNVASAQILAKYTKADPAVIETQPRSHFAEELNPASLQPLIDVAAKYNNFTTFPARDLIFAGVRT